MLEENEIAMMHKNKSDYIFFSSKLPVEYKWFEYKKFFFLLNKTDVYKINRHDMIDRCNLIHSIRKIFQ